MVEYSSNSGGGGSNDPVTPHAIVHVEANVFVRPGGCLLPAAVRKGMALPDYAQVRLYLVSSLMTSTALPRTVVLQRICWNDTTSTDEDSLPSIEYIKNQLRQRINEAHHYGRPFILHDKQVINITVPKMPCSLSTTVDGSVVPDELVHNVDFVVRLEQGQVASRCVTSYSYCSRVTQQL